MSEKKQDGELGRLMRALCYSCSGIASAFSREKAFRLEVYAGGLLFPLALFLPFDMTSKAILLGSMALVLIVELLNSAIEELCDHVSEETHPRIKRIKDMASGAVFLSLMASLGAWIFAFKQL